MHVCNRCTPLSLHPRHATARPSAPPAPLPRSPFLCCTATHSRPLCRPLVVFCLFNCNLNKVLKHNQRPGCLSVSSLSSKPPSKYDPVHFFCLAPRPWSTLGGRAWANTEIWLRFEIPPLTKFQILALSALVTELRYKLNSDTTAVSPPDLQPSQHLLLSGALTPGSQSIGNAEVKSTMFHYCSGRSSPPSQLFLQCLSVCDMSDSINISMLPLVLLQVPVLVLVLTCPQMKDKTRK